MAYDSDSIKDMISSLKRYGYGYTEFKHKGGVCSINTSILLDALETQVKEEGMHLVKLFTFVTDDTLDRKLIYTNAPDYVIESICKEIKEDGLLDNTNKINGILDVLKARGYKYKTVDDIPEFGFLIR